MTTLHTGGREFPDTRWTLLQRAGSGEESATPALSEFTGLYYAAVQAFIQAIVRNDDIARDLTQEFFEDRVLRSRHVLSKAKGKDGRFRHYLKETIRNFLIDRFRANARTPQASVRPDVSAGEWERLLVDGAETAEQALIRESGQAIVRLALDRVRQAAESNGQADHFAMFEQRYLADPDRPPSFREVGRTFDLDEKTARGRVVTIANQFRAQLEGLLRDAAGPDADIDLEIRNLIEML